MSFWTKYSQATKLHNSFVCVGLDSELSKIPECVKGELNPIWAFNKEIVDATKNKTAAYKLNYAFYLSSGKKGIEALENTINYIPSYIPIILDVKVGDIANTMEQYGKAYFEEMNVDAITVNPLMGSDVYTPLLKYTDKMLFVLVLTSNPSSAEYLAKNDMYKDIAQSLSKKDFRNFGAVTGATNAQEMKTLRTLMPKSIFLIPGVGAQGGSVAETVHNAAFSKNEPRFLINSSRGIIFASKGENFATEALNATEDLRTQINNNLFL